jgi:DUF4097 and DUF4098 domain-containing protein YvlB
MKTFLDDLRKELEKKNLRRDEIDDIISDHRDMIQAAMEDGLEEADIQKTFGEPVKIADDIAEDTSKNIEEDSADSHFVEWLAVEPESEQIEIYVDVIGDAVSYRISDDNKIRVTYNHIKKIDKYNVTFKEGVLKIKAPKISGLVFMARQSSGAFDIHIPKNVDVRRITQHGVNADVTMRNINTASFDLNTTNGDVKITDSALGFVSMNSVNGDVHVDHLSAKEVKMSQVSGNTNFKDVTIKTVLKLNTVSGDIKLDNVKADVTHFQSVSGDVNGVEFYPDALTFNSVSGNLKLTNQAAHTITRLKTHTLSGTIET